MPDSCVAYGCSNERNVETRSRGITFHRFPKDVILRTEWERIVKLKGFVASQRSLLCSQHFKAEDFDRTGQIVRLRGGVKPSILTFPSHLRKQAKLRTTQTSRKTKESLKMDLSKPLHEAKCQSNLMPIHAGPTVSLMDKIKNDHCYALPASPGALKARLDQALATVEKLEQVRKNSMIRERRAKRNMDVILEELSETNLINEELKQRLVCFSGLSLSSSLSPTSSP